MRRKYFMLLPVALSACLEFSLGAQEIEVKQPQPASLGVINDVDVTVTDLTEEKLSNPPKRETKFERLDESVKQKLPKADPKLFEQKYVAAFSVKIPTSGNHSVIPRDPSGRLPPAINFRAVAGTDRGSSSGRSSTAGYFISQLVSSLAAEDLPAKEEREFFSNPENFGEMIVLTTADDGRLPSSSTTWHFTILGTTPELVESRATALLTILDRGISRPIQLAIFKRRGPLSAQIRDKRKVMAEAQRLASLLQGELKSYVDFTPDMLSNLRVQQLQLDVDLAGVKARIAACDRLLAGTALKPERRSQVEDLKVAAEIEFSGYEARLLKSNEFIGKVKTKVDLLGKLSTAESQQSGARDYVGAYEREIRNIDAAIYAYGPFLLADNKVTIQPLEWTQ